MNHPLHHSVGAGRTGDRATSQNNRNEHPNSSQVGYYGNEGVSLLPMGDAERTRTQYGWSSKYDEEKEDINRRHSSSERRIRERIERTHTMPSHQETLFRGWLNATAASDWKADEAQEIDQSVLEDFQKSGNDAASSLLQDSWDDESNGSITEVASITGSDKLGATPDTITDPLEEFHSIRTPEHKEQDEVFYLPTNIDNFVGSLLMAMCQRDRGAAAAIASLHDQLEKEKRQMKDSIARGLLNKISFAERGIGGIAEAITDNEIAKKLPMVISLTSFPFRIFHSTEAFDRFDSSGAIGQTLYDLFALKQTGPFPAAFGVTGAPPIGMQNVLSHKLGTMCQIEVFPIFADPRAPDKGLLYYGTLLHQVIPNHR